MAQRVDYSVMELENFSREASPARASPGVRWKEEVGGDEETAGGVNGELLPQRGGEDDNFLQVDEGGRYVSVLLYSWKRWEDLGLLQLATPLSKVWCTVEVCAGAKWPSRWGE